MTDAQQRWREGLAAWAIPPHILAAAPQSPWGFEPDVFSAAADEALARADDSPSDAAARSALEGGGTVLDVGAGAGAACLRLHASASRLVAIDPSAALLTAFRERAARVGVDHEAVVGTWPDDAGAVEAADVVTCHHVTYNVPALGDFAAALRARARRRVVIEMTREHPLAWMTPLWAALHGLTRPRGPTADDAEAVLREVGWDPEVVRWERSYSPLGEHDDGALARLARRLCLPPDRHDELEALLRRHPPPSSRPVVTFVEHVT